MVILHNNKKGNNYLVAKTLAKHFNCETVAAEDNPCLLQFDNIIIVVSNTGDEEISQPMEDYLSALTVKNKKYSVCELGNYFGFESYAGCKKVVSKILDALGWEKISDVSLDSLPTLDEDSLEKWINQIKKEPKLYE